MTNEEISSKDLFESPRSEHMIEKKETSLYGQLYLKEADSKVFRICVFVPANLVLFCCCAVDTKGRHKISRLLKIARRPQYFATH